jgi:hypothetical protein
MAKKIEKHKFRSSKYDWDNWLDGDIWVLTQGEDFEVELSTMRSTILGAAYRKGLRARTTLDMKAKTITIQAFKK